MQTKTPDDSWKTRESYARQHAYKIMYQGRIFSLLECYMNHTATIAGAGLLIALRLRIPPYCYPVEDWKPRHPIYTL